LRVQYIFIFKIEMAIEYLRTNTTNTRRAANDHKNTNSNWKLQSKKANWTLRHSHSVINQVGNGHNHNHKRSQNKTVWKNV